MLFSGVALRTFIVHLLFDFKSNMFEVQSIQYEVYVADLDFVRVCFFASCPVFVCPLFFSLICFTCLLFLNLKNIYV